MTVGDRARARRPGLIDVHPGRRAPPRRGARAFTMTGVHEADFEAFCDRIMDLLVDAGCGGCSIAATISDRNCDVTLWDRDVEIVADLLARGLAHKADDDGVRG